MELDNSQLKCETNHVFDLSKTGYVNLIRFPAKSHYNKDLFKARSTIIENGFFRALEREIENQIGDFAIQKDDLTILDAGCGDGSLFSNLLLRLKNKSFNAIGIDISKHGIQIASKRNHKTMWLVADIANIPIKDKSIDVVLNTLSPANYQEFSRILKDDGILIKTVPDNNHLIELRDLISKGAYSNANIVNLFKDHTNFVSQVKVFEEKSLDNSEKANIIKMAPLAWDTKVDYKELSKTNNIITLDLSVLVGKMKTHNTELF